MKRLLQPGSFTGYGFIIGALTLAFGVPEETATQIVDTAGPFAMAVLGLWKIVIDDGKWL